MVAPTPQKRSEPIPQSNIKNKQLREARDDIMKAVRSEMEATRQEILQMIQTKN